MARDIFVAVQRLALTKQVPSQEEVSNCVKPLHHVNPNAIGNMLSHISNLKYAPSSSTSLTTDKQYQKTNKNNLDNSTLHDELLLNFLNIVPSEIIYLMALYLDDQNLYSLLTCSLLMKNIIDDEQFWQMKCELIFDREMLVSYRNEFENYKKIYTTFVDDKKPFYHLKDSVGNVFTFLETNDSSLLSFFEFGIVFVDPRELVELNEMLSESLSLPIENQRSIENVTNNLLKMFTMGIREVGILIDITECNFLSESECNSKFVQVQEIVRKVGYRTLNIFYIDYKTNHGIPEMLNTIAKIPQRGQPSKPLRGFIIDIEQQTAKWNNVSLIAKVAVVGGDFNKQHSLRILGKNESVLLSSCETSPLYSDENCKELPKILRVHMKFLNPNGSPFKRNEQLCILDEFPPKKTKSFNCQVISLGLEMVVGDLLLCVGARFKNLVRIKTLVSTIDKRTGRVANTEPTSISKSEAGIIDFEIIDESLCMIAPFTEYPMCGRLCFYSLPSNINLESYQSQMSAKIKIVEQFSPGAVSVCKSICSD